jgi:pimeloyl-ACP methyl ester carboxylesterase
LCLNDEHWIRDGVNHGEVLATELGYTPLYLRYNTGLPIASNGRELAARLESLLCNWPGDKFELAIAGHSMGGLVARSACHYGRQAGHNWLQHLKKLVFIGTPHHGAPLERGGNWVNFAMDLSPYAAPFTRVANRRSAGITDLRHGHITDDKKEFVPLPAEIDCYAMAASLAKKPGRIHKRLIGDGLVPLDSALGRSGDPATTLKIPDNHQWHGTETGHIEMLGRTGLYKQLRGWLE